MYVLVMSEDWATFYSFLDACVCSALALSLTGGEDGGRSRRLTSGERAEGHWAMR